MDTKNIKDKIKKKNILKKETLKKETHKKDIVIVWDFDLTLTEEYGHVPFFKKYFEVLKKAGLSEGVPINTYEDCYRRGDALKGDLGLNFKQRLIWDIQKGGCLEGMTIDELIESGNKVKCAKGLKEFFNNLNEKFKDNVNFHHYIISLGQKVLIESFLKKNKISQYFEDVIASEFHIDEKRKIVGIKKVLFPMNKIEYLIGIIKGSHSKLNLMMNPNDYKYNFRDLIVIGDGGSDLSKFSYAKRRGAIPIGVYTSKNDKSFDKAIEKYSSRVDYLLPRDYSIASETYSVFVEAVNKILSRNCNFNPSELYSYYRGKIVNEEEKKFVKTHISSCKSCKSFFEQKILDTQNKIILISRIK